MAGEWNFFLSQLCHDIRRKNAIIQLEFERDISINIIVSLKKLEDLHVTGETKNTLKRLATYGLWFRYHWNKTKFSH